MADLNNLYREVIMDHYKNPRNKGLVSDSSYVLCSLKNPSCGDKIKIETKIQDGKIIDIRHDGEGCSICCASASIMSERVKGLEVDYSKEVINNYLKMVSNQEYDTNIDFEDLEVFQGIKDFPARVRCASIASQAFLMTLEKKENE